LKRKPFLGRTSTKRRRGKGGGNRNRTILYFDVVVCRAEQGRVYARIFKNTTTKRFNSTTCMMMLLECRRKQRGAIQVINREETPFLAANCRRSEQTKGPREKGKTTNTLTETTATVNVSMEFKLWS